MPHIEDKIISFGNLEEGWNFGEGSPASKEVIDKALEIYWIGRRYKLACEVFPATDCGIMVSFYKEDQFIDFDIETDLHINFVREVGIGFKYEEVECVENISHQDIINKIYNLATSTIEEVYDDRYNKR